MRAILRNVPVFMVVMGRKGDGEVMVALGTASPGFVR